MTWEDAWREGRTPWDAGATAPALLELVRSGTLPSGPALVPGCGAGYDACALAAPNRPTLGLDLAPSARSRFEAVRAERGVSPEICRFEAHSFFDHEPTERYALIWDYTFLCALPPDLRPDWARAMVRCLAADGELITLIFPVDSARGATDGPPYTMSVELVTELLAPEFKRVWLERCQHTHPNREGKEWLARWRHSP